MAQEEPIRLPKTIEGAQSRYLGIYDTYSTSGPHDKERLRNYAIAKIQALRKRAPIFFETKLPDIVNQAASALLTCDTNTPVGESAFNNTHREFLSVLDDLRRSQPSGSVSFQSERDRFKLKDKYKKEHLMLRERLDKLEASELSTDELGEESCDSKYSKILIEIDRTRARLGHIAHLIAKLEGENVEEELRMQLPIPPRSLLNRLTSDQIRALETQLDAYFAKNKKSADFFPDRQVLELMFKDIKVNLGQFDKAETIEFFKETLEAIRAFFRNKDNKRRADFHDNLISNKRLRPKEGIILANPDDIPEEVKQKLEDSEKETQKKLERYLEEYSIMPCDEMKGCDDIEEDAENENDDLNNDIRLEMEINKPLFLRVKEEPRDDYAESEASGDECVVSDRVQVNFEAGPVRNEPEEEEEEEEEAAPSPEIEEYDVVEDDDDNDEEDQRDSGVEKGDSEEGKNEGEEDDDEVECLGIIEPTDKCPLIDYEKDESHKKT